LSPSPIWGAKSLERGQQGPKFLKRGQNHRVTLIKKRDDASLDFSLGAFGDTGTNDKKPTVRVFTWTVATTDSLQGELSGIPAAPKECPEIQAGGTWSRRQRKMRDEEEVSMPCGIWWSPRLFSPKSPRRLVE
jgi:hypothetical protein